MFSVKKKKNERERESKSRKIFVISFLLFSLLNLLLTTIFSSKPQLETVIAVTIGILLFAFYFLFTLLLNSVLSEKLTIGTAVARIAILPLYGLLLRGLLAGGGMRVFIALSTAIEFVIFIFSLSLSALFYDWR